jgi:hypothetical protein
MFIKINNINKESFTSAVSLEDLLSDSFPKTVLSRASNAPSYSGVSPAYLYHHKSKKTAFFVFPGHKIIVQVL